MQAKCIWKSFWRWWNTPAVFVSSIEILFSKSVVALVIKNIFWKYLYFDRFFKSILPISTMQKYPLSRWGPSRSSRGRAAPRCSWVYTGFQNSTQHIVAALNALVGGGTGLPWHIPWDDAQGWHTKLRGLQIWVVLRTLTQSKHIRAACTFSLMNRYDRREIFSFHLNR